MAAAVVALVGLDVGLRFGMTRDTWTPNVLRFFIDALVDEYRAGNRPNKTLNRIGKDNVVQRMKDYIEADWNWETCKHKWDELKKKWSCWKSLLKWSGVTFHPDGTINMPKHWWDARIAENKIAKVFKRCRLEHEDKLDYIFSRMEPVNVGPHEEGGHEGGRGVPTQHLDSDTSDDSDDDQPPAPPQAMHTTSMTSASYGKRRSSDHPVSGADFWEGLKKFMDDVSAPKKQKQTDNACKKAEDDVEYETLMRELLDAGVDPKSDEYFMASEVLLEAPC
ncbi:hypothetical protein BS78_09G092400 [Paspalum vaginatum]|nr:hypothetical protein BS78_09G092400 [Paspalum vaginatum]